MTPPSTSFEKTVAAIHDLVRARGGDPESFAGEMITQLVQTSLKLIGDGHDHGQLKLLNRALKDMRYAYRVFNRYRDTRKITIFGSARTAEDHPDYLAAREFSAAVARHGWMSITGAG
ncbi:MAG: LOG family protein, partial [Planctomycetota bacterium]